MKPVLVAGATGQVGRHVVAGLAERSITARALTRDTWHAERLFAELGIPSGAIEIVRGDFTDIDSLREAAKGCDQLFLASADHADQVRMEMNVAGAALAAGDCHIVKVSSCDAAPDAPYLWARNHVAIESQIAMRTTEFSFLRPHYFMQNLLSFADEVKSRKTLSAPAGAARFGMIDARDIASVAAALLAERSPLRRTAELTGPEPVSFADAAAALTAATGQEVRYVGIAEEEFQRVLTGEWGVAPDSAADIIRNYQDARDGKFAVRTDEVETIAGHRPRSISQFASDYAAEFQ